jgi:hypothetical protein
MPTLAAATARLRQASCDLAADLIGLRADPWLWEGSCLHIIRSFLVRVRLAGCRFVLFVSRCCQSYFRESQASRYVVSLSWARKRRNCPVAYAEALSMAMPTSQPRVSIFVITFR